MESIGWSPKGPGCSVGESMEFGQFRSGAVLQNADRIHQSGESTQRSDRSHGLERLAGKSARTDFELGPKRYTLTLSRFKSLEIGSVLPFARFDIVSCGIVSRDKNSSYRVGPSAGGASFVGATRDFDTPCPLSAADSKAVDAIGGGDVA